MQVVTKIDQTFNRSVALEKVIFGEKKKTLFISTIDAPR